MLGFDVLILPAKHDSLELFGETQRAFVSVFALPNALGQPCVRFRFALPA